MLRYSRSIESKAFLKSRKRAIPVISFDHVKLIISVIFLTFSPIYLSLTYPVSLGLMISGSAVLNLFTIALVARDFVVYV